MLARTVEELIALNKPMCYYTNKVNIVGINMPEGVNCNKKINIAYPMWGESSEKICTVNLKLLLIW